MKKNILMILMFGMLWGICIQTSVNAAVQKENGLVQKNETINIFTKILNEQSNKKNGFVQKNKTVDTLTKISNKGQSLDKYDPYRLAQFPMGCQYKGYELCDPIYDPDELGDDYIEVDNGYTYIYAPMKRLYFPDDSAFSDRKTTPKAAEIDDYVGEWSAVTAQYDYGEIRKLGGNSLEIEIGMDIYTCHDLIVKARDYLVYFCRMDKESSVWQDTPKPAKEPYDAYLLLDFDFEEEWSKKTRLSITPVKYLPCLQEVPSVDAIWFGKGYNGPALSPLCSSQRLPYNWLTYWEKPDKGE